MTVSASSTCPARSDGLAQPEVLYQSESTRVVRLGGSGGSSGLIHKEPLGANALERLRHESRILNRLGSIDGVVRLAAAPHRAGVLVLHDCMGVPLAQVLRKGALDIAALLSLALQLARLVSKVHCAGVIHQDINPSNILLCGAQRQPLLIDFDRASTFAEGQPGFTHHRDIPGTLAYLAPEQTGRTGRTVDQRADLYSLGATLYEMATGHPPFTAEDPLQLIHDHLARLPQVPAELDPDLPQGLSDAIMRLLEKEPDRRYQSAEGWAHDLARLIQARAEGGSGALALGERDFALRLTPPSRQIGREREIAALHAAFEDALRGSNRGV
ncbi:MAG: serine/threonine protein kinase, partial [Gemmatimonadetes bacterium]|nr:serine/threonine protein kinase [Gemmatimonadota bacterium]